MASLSTECAKCLRGCSCAPLAACDSNCSPLSSLFSERDLTTCTSQWFEGRRCCTKHSLGASRRPLLLLGRSAPDGIRQHHKAIGNVIKRLQQMQHRERTAASTPACLPAWLRPTCPPFQPACSLPAYQCRAPLLFPWMSAAFAGQHMEVLPYVPCLSQSMVVFRRVEEWQCTTTSYDTIDTTSCLAVPLSLWAGAGTGGRTTQLWLRQQQGHPQAASDRVTPRGGRVGSPATRRSWHLRVVVFVLDKIFILYWVELCDLLPRQNELLRMRRVSWRTVPAYERRSSSHQAATRSPTPCSRGTSCALPRSRFIPCLEARPAAAPAPRLSTCSLASLEVSSASGTCTLGAPIDRAGVSSLSTTKSESHALALRRKIKGHRQSRPD